VVIAASPNASAFSRDARLEAPNGHWPDRPSRYDATLGNPLV